LPIDMRKLGVDFLATSGHKGLLGPLGTGVVAIRPEVAPLLRSVRQGGTGTQSERPQQPDELPGKFESGNLNVPGILGLAAGVAYLKARGLEDVERHGQQLCQQLLTGLGEIPELRVFGPPGSSERVPLVSLVAEGYDPQELALLLDATRLIQVRPGLHCAPRMHEALGTQAGGGTVRFSLGPFNTSEEIETTIAALAEIVR